MDTLSLTKEAEIYNGQRTSLKTDAWKNGQNAKCKRKMLEHFLPPYTTINFHRIKDLNVSL